MGISAKAPRRRQCCRLTAASIAALIGVARYAAALAAEPDEPLVEIVVTGSRLSSANTSSPSPIVVLDNEELRHQGTARAEDLLDNLPQVNSGLTPRNGASVAPLTGTATADLRGMRVPHAGVDEQQAHAP